MHHRSLNFITPPNGRLRLLQAGTLSAVVVSVAMTVVVFGAIGDPSERTASILDGPTPAVSAPPTVAPKESILPQSLSENPISSIALGKGKDTARYHEQHSGKAFVVDLPTLRIGALSERRVPGFLRAYWIPHVNSAVSVIQEPGGVVYRYSDYDTQQISPVSSPVGDIVVSPDGRSVAYLQQGEDAYTLKVGAPDGSSARTLLTTRTAEPRLNWITDTELSLLSRRSDKAGRDLSLINENGDLSVILASRENLEIQWSPDGTLLLYSYFVPDSGVSLWLYSRQTGASAPLGMQTSAHKCAWHTDNQSVVCGVPINNTLARDVAADHTATIDSIIVLDLASGFTSTLYTGAIGTLFGVVEPMISSSGRYFIFKNMFDSRPYLIPLN